MKGEKRNVKRILKNKRLIQKRKEAYTNVLGTLFISFFIYIIKENHFLQVVDEFSIDSYMRI